MTKHLKLLERAGKAKKLNDEFSVYFGDTYVDFKISELIPGKKVVWTEIDCNLHWIKDKMEWNNTEVIWNLTAKAIRSNSSCKILMQRKGICTMKYVVIGESSGASMDAIMKVYPRHKAIVDVFIAEGDVIGIGPFTDLGNMAIFRTKEAAESFSKKDPFILEGLVKSFVIREWNDGILK